MSRFRFVADYQHTYQVKRLCELVEIERSSYYAWRADGQLAMRIRAIQPAGDHCGQRAPLPVDRGVDLGGQPTA